MKKIIELRNITKSYDGNIILDNFNLTINENEFVTLVGPSGCGKTTLLRLIGGFEALDQGEIIFSGNDISKQPAYEREINTVFQKYALFPHLNVYDNIAFGLKMQKKSKSEIVELVN
ncbi:MAG: ABC transporter ATP-binding protein, partial [Bacilli bacterium]